MQFEEEVFVGCKYERDVTAKARRKLTCGPAYERSKEQPIYLSISDCQGERSGCSNHHRSKPESSFGIIPPVRSKLDDLTATLRAETESGTSSTRTAWRRRSPSADTRGRTTPTKRPGAKKCESPTYCKMQSRLFINDIC